MLSYEQAANKARALARGDANAAADRPATIGEALDAYDADLVARGRDPYICLHLDLQFEASAPIAAECSPHHALQGGSRVVRGMRLAGSFAIVSGGQGADLKF